MELFESRIRGASLDPSKPIAEAVSELRQGMKDLNVPSIPPEQIDQIPDSFIEAMIRTVRRLSALPLREQEREIYGRPLDEIDGTFDDTANTA